MDIYICIVFSTLFSLNIHFRCLNTYFFVTKCFMGLTQSSVAIKCIYLYMYMIRLRTQPFPGYS